MSAARLRALPLVVRGLLRVEVGLRELVERVADVREEAQIALARARFPELRPGLCLQDHEGIHGVVEGELHADPWLHLIGVRVRWQTGEEPDPVTLFIPASTAWKMRLPREGVQ